jgi:hypothetical protein
MTSIYGTVTQSLPHYPYDIVTNGPIMCNSTNGIEDWVINQHGDYLGPFPDGTYTTKCSQLNPDLCKLAENMGGLSATGNVEWAGTMTPGQPSVPIVCEWKLTGPPSFEAIEAWAHEFGLASEPNTNAIMTSYCSQIINSKVGESPCLNGAASCSVLTSASPGGGVCRIWYNNIDQTDKDTAIQEICTADNASLKECACAQRSINPTYISLKPYTGIMGDSCWYVPCNEEYTLVPSGAIGTCPPNICQEIINVVGTGGSASVHDNTSSINCPFSPEQIDSLKPKPIPPIPPIPVSLKDENPNRIYLVLSIAVVVIFIVGVVALFRTISKYRK